MIKPPKPWPRMPYLTLKYPANDYVDEKPIPAGEILSFIYEDSGFTAFLWKEEIFVVESVRLTPVRGDELIFIGVAADRGPR